MSAETNRDGRINKPWQNLSKEKDAKGEKVTIHANVKVSGYFIKCAEGVVFLERNGESVQVVLNSGVVILPFQKKEK